MTFSITHRLAVLIAACTILASPSHAYLDPGTGSIILQSILAGIAVAMGVLRLYWYRIKSFFSASGRGPTDQDADGNKGVVSDAEIQNES